MSQPPSPNPSGGAKPDQNTLEPWQVLLWQSSRFDRVSAVWNYHRAVPFHWGVSDCATLMADMAWALTGTDPLEGLRTYSSRDEAARLLVGHGYRSMTEFCDQRWDKAPRHLLCEGDLAVVDTPDALGCPAVVIGSPCASKNETGVVIIPRSRTLYGYKLSCRS